MSRLLKMPLNSPTDNNSGRLYIVGTPIGNMDDITLRALHILSKADIVAAEDTRNTGKLLAHHNIKAHLVSYHEHNETEQAKKLIVKMKGGCCVALVSDAGTPSVSDPGYRIITQAIAEGLLVIPVPGVSAVLTALCASGLPTDTFVFAGFLPKKKGARQALLDKLAKETRTIIVYESPKRILTLLEEVGTIMGDRSGVLCREMTKPYEEFIRGSLSQISSLLRQKTAIKGECTLVISGQPKKTDISEDVIRQEIIIRLIQSESSPSDLAKEMAREYNLPKKKIYGEIIKIKEDGLA